MPSQYLHMMRLKLIIASLIFYPKREEIQFHPKKEQITKL